MWSDRASLRGGTGFGWSPYTILRRAEYQFGLFVVMAYSISHQLSQQARSSSQLTRGGSRMPNLGPSDKAGKLREHTAAKTPLISLAIAADANGSSSGDRGHDRSY